MFTVACLSSRVSLDLSLLARDDVSACVVGAAAMVVRMVLSMAVAVAPWKNCMVEGLIVCMCVCV